MATERRCDGCAHYSIATLQQGSTKDMGVCHHAATRGDAEEGAAAAWANGERP